MKRLLITAAALVVAWPTLPAPVHAESALDRVLGGDERHDDRDGEAVEHNRDNPDRQDIERNQDKLDHDRGELRRDRREGDTAGVRQERREINREEGRVDRDREGVSGSSRAPDERRDDN